MLPPLTRRTSIALAVATAWPTVYVLGFFLLWFLWVLGIVGVAVLGASEHQQLATVLMALMMGGFGIIFIAHLLTMLDMVLVLVYYVIHASTNPKLDGTQKAMWIVSFLFAGMLGALLAYWWQYLRIPKAPSPLP